MRARGLRFLGIILLAGAAGASCAIDAGQEESVDAPEALAENALPLQVTLQPNAAAGKDAELRSFAANNNFGTDPRLTHNFGLLIAAIIQFDLSAIPLNAPVTSATLTLFHEANIDPDQWFLSKNNAAWSESTVTWNNSPAFGPGTAASWFAGPPGSFDTIDVTASVQSFVNGAPNFGWRMTRATSTGSWAYYQSSDHPDATHHPKLVVTFGACPDGDGDTVCDDDDNCPSAGNLSQSDLDGDNVGDACDPSTCLSVQRGASGLVEDAHIASEKPAKNYGESPTMITGKLVSGALRQTLLRFDLSAVPVGATVLSTALTLNREFAYGAGTVSLHNVLAPWAEGLVTWNGFAGASDPAVATSFSVSSTYTGPVVVNDAGFHGLVQGWANGGANNGLLLDEVGVSFPGGIGFSNFNSSDAPSTALRPKLDLCFSVP